METALAAAHAASSSFIVGVSRPARPAAATGLSSRPSDGGKGWWADMDASRGSWGKRQKLGWLLRHT
ncbi:hypothetical protein TPA0598_05_01880 [Streptomyces lydicamycinicus]|uniref:Uncharacterized protein n=1 Tax=Streptomyces lydicamycinicus TaxID=1546107 RepID=A0A0N7YLQ5_9ACTN|nr:hypothetical protein TPA0598_05_01880 [Streptomyces lydicamycinicus]